MRSSKGSARWAVNSSLPRGPNMNFKPGDVIFVEYYGQELYGKVESVEGKVLHYRNEIGQLFSAPLEDVQPASQEMVDYFDV